MKNKVAKQILIPTILVFLLSQSLMAVNIIINTNTDTLYMYDDFDIVGNTLSNNGNGVSGTGWFNKWSYTETASEPLHVNEAGSLIYPSASNAIGSGGYIEKVEGASTAIERSLIF